MVEALQTYRPMAMTRLPLDAEGRARNIVEKLGGVWHGTRGECRCPAHDDASPSLSVRLGDTAILFHCFAGCTTIDVMKALQRRRLHDRSAVAMQADKPKRDMGVLALRLWKAGTPIVGTLAEDYLRGRGLSSPFPKALRFNPATILGSGADRRTMPAMIAAVENDLGVVAVQRTFLDPEDILRKPIPKPKVSLGLLRRDPTCPCHGRVGPRRGHRGRSIGDSVVRHSDLGAGRGRTARLCRHPRQGTPRDRVRRSWSSCRAAAAEGAWAPHRQWP
jgi:putative DNA primase/helicase